MKAISINPFYTMAMLQGHKTIECRSWKTDYRGDLLICSTKPKIPETIPGHALCIVELYDIVPFKKKHLHDAFMEQMPEKSSFAWIFRNLRYIRPFPVKGQQRLWECDHDIVFIDDDDEESANKYIIPLIV